MALHGQPLTLPAMLLATSCVFAQSMPGMEVELRPTTRPEVRHAQAAAVNDYPSLATRLDLPALNIEEQREIKRLASDPTKAYVGIGREARLTTPNWALVEEEEGEEREESDDRIWQAQIHSPDSLSLKVRFTDFALAPETSVKVYALHGSPSAPIGEYKGSGTSHNGTFWSLTVPGNTVVVEYWIPAKSTTEPGAFPFKVERISHTFRGKDGKLYGIDEPQEKPQSQSEGQPQSQPEDQPEVKATRKPC